MARYTEAVCRKCRREGNKLYLKGDKCYSAKCILEKKNYFPGMGRGSKLVPNAPKLSEYGIQLRAKQKVRNVYGVLERQFRRYFAMAVRQKGVTGENLLQILERRIDNVIFRLGFATSRAAARQLVLHGHVRVNGKVVNVPNHLVKVGDTIALKNGDLTSVKLAIESTKKRPRPEWLSVDFDSRTGKILALPNRAAIDLPVQEKLIVELYSK